MVSKFFLSVRFHELIMLCRSSICLLSVCHCDTFQKEEGTSPKIWSSCQDWWQHMHARARTPQEGMEMFTPHIRRLSRESSAGLPSWPENGLRARKGDALGASVVRGRGPGEGFCMGRCLSGLNFPPVPKEAAPSLCLRAKMWGRKKRGRDEALKMSAVKHQKNRVRPYLHFSTCLLVAWTHY